MSHDDDDESHIDDDQSPSSKGKRNTKEKKKKVRKICSKEGCTRKALSGGTPWCGEQSEEMQQGGMYDLRFKS